MTEASWPPDWLRGVLGVCVLHVLAQGETYGYAIAGRLADAGFGAVKGGTLYPLLARFEDQGLVAVQWRAGDAGPGRKYYRLTTAGRQAWRTQTRDWAAFAELTMGFIGANAHTGGPWTTTAAQEGAS